MPRVSSNVVRVKFIPFALKDDAKRWMYSLNVGSISSWDSFVNIFHKRYFPSSKTIRLSNEILSFAQLEQEPLWGYMSRFKELLVQCPHHGSKR